MHVKKRLDHSWWKFFKRTIAAQTHFATALLAIVGLVMLLPVSAKMGPLHLWGTITFSVTAILVFGTSAIYHFLHDGYEASPQLTVLLEKLDQWAIYLFIAGTYTPFLINVVASPWREILMVSVWVMALTGILYTAFRHKFPVWAQSRIVYTAVFLLMGWTVLVRMGEVWQKLSMLGLALLLSGAVSYSVGAVCYIVKKPRLFEGVFGFHELWHVLVTLGFAFHFALVWNFYSHL
jgi:hemolysin III